MMKTTEKDVGYWILDTGCWILDAGYSILLTIDEHLSKKTSRITGTSVYNLQLASAQPSPSEREQFFVATTVY